MGGEGNNSLSGSGQTEGLKVRSFETSSSSGNSSRHHGWVDLFFFCGGVGGILFVEITK